MYCSLKSMRNYVIEAVDGKIGHIDDFYFDDYYWVIRYFVVNPQEGILGTDVLISPKAFDEFLDQKKHSIKSCLTCEQIKNSPTILSHRPVSKKEELKLVQYYNWPLYWDQEAETTGVINYIKKESSRFENSCDVDYHLRSMQEVLGYHIHALDGHIGHVEDFIVDLESHRIKYLLVNTHNWIPGKKVLVSPLWVQKIEWSQNEVYIDLKKDQIEKSPKYEKCDLIDHEYEKDLHKHYKKEFLNRIY